MNPQSESDSPRVDQPAYPVHQSRWFGCVKRERLRIVFAFYSPDGNEVAMPIACMSAYLKKFYPWVEVLLEPVLILRDVEKYTLENYARCSQTSTPICLPSRSGVRIGIQWRTI
ncbi:MAG: hypothetical protein ACI8TQ_002731 [Planctomycetota bacterium]|jgi:hypothetical protein